MADAMRKARLRVKAQMVLPKAVREVLNPKPGDEFAFVIRDREIRVVRAPAWESRFGLLNDGACRELSGFRRSGSTRLPAAD
jgi:AbrB family looped-hinge helix DNA binding protein